jgi:hypothetical protein
VKNLSALLMAALLSTPACAAPPSAAEKAFADACRLSQYDCRGVQAPQIRRSAFVEPLGFYGVYLGGNIVYVAIDVDYAHDPSAYAIVVHEIVHYLQETIGHLRPSTNLLEVCTKEEEAYVVSNALLVELNLADKARAFPYDHRCAFEPVVE